MTPDGLYRWLMRQPFHELLKLQLATGYSLTYDPRGRQDQLRIERDLIQAVLKARIILDEEKPRPTLIPWLSAAVLFLLILVLAWAL